MGAAASSQSSEEIGVLLGDLVGSRSYDLRDTFWDKLLLLTPHFQWPDEQACQQLALHNRSTSHLPKLLLHLVRNLQESPASALKVLNAAYFSRVFLKYVIQHEDGDISEHLSLTVSDHEASKLFLATPIATGEVDVPGLVVLGLFSFLSASDVNPYTYILHLELVNLLLVMVSTQLRCGGPHPFLDAALSQEGTVVNPFVRKLLLSFIAGTPLPSEAAYFSSSAEDQSGFIRKVSNAAATVFMLPYYTYTYLLSSSENAFSRSPLADSSLLLLLILTHHRKNIPGTEEHELNPFRQALDCALDTEFGRLDIEQCGQCVRVPFAALYDRLGSCLTDDAPVLLLYCLVHGNPAFLEYVLVRTDLDTLVMPLLEMLYNVSKQSSKQIYMLLIVCLILSQDDTFNASVHKLVLPGVPWYKERLLPGITLGSLMLVILVRIVKFNLSRLEDTFLHTNCLAVLANMAPHMNQLNSYASQRLVSLFDMIARKYNKLQMEESVVKGEGVEHTAPPLPERQIFTDFLRIVLEIINAILAHGLSRNPEVVYALLHRQELFEAFKENPRFADLVQNIVAVLGFFNVRLDDQKASEEWSVERVLQVIIANARSWRGEGIKTTTQLRFTYEEELHPEEFFLPYIWQLVTSRSNVYTAPSKRHPLIRS